MIFPSPLGQLRQIQQNYNWEEIFNKMEVPTDGEKLRVIQEGRETDNVTLVVSHTLRLIIQYGKQRGP